MFRSQDRGFFNYCTTMLQWSPVLNPEDEEVHELVYKQHFRLLKLSRNVTFSLYRIYLQSIVWRTFYLTFPTVRYKRNKFQNKFYNIKANCTISFCTIKYNLSSLFVCLFVYCFLFVSCFFNIVRWAKDRSQTLVLPITRTINGVTQYGA